MNFKFKDLFRQPLTLFLIIWSVLNLVQAGLTPLNNDEAYYWMYSKYLDWGFFDHPPVIALMIKIGYLVFHTMVCLFHLEHNLSNMIGLPFRTFIIINNKYLSINYKSIVKQIKKI